MPVIQLPFDDRWGQLGRGLGNVIGSVVQAAADKQIDTGVAQIIGDDAVPQDQKVNNIMQRFGLKGIQSYTKLMDLRVKQSQLNELDAKTKNEQLLGKYAQDTLEARVADAQLKPKKTAAEIADTSAQTAERIALTDPTVRLRQSQAQREQVEADILSQQFETYQNMNLDPKQMDTGIRASLHNQGIDDPTEQNQVIEAFRMAGPGKGPAAAQQAVNAIKSDHARVKAAEVSRDKPTQIPTTQVSQAANSSALATSTDNFMSALERSGESSGMMTGAPLKAWLEKHGFSTGDPNILSMYENQMQAISQKATTGGGFFAQGRVTLAHDVTGNLSKSPLANIIAADTIADQQLAELRTVRSSLVRGQNSKPLDEAIDKWDAIKKKLDLHSFVTQKDTAGNQRSVVYYKGNQIDPASLHVIVPGQKDYQTGAGTIRGSDLMSAAEQRGLTPAQILTMLRAKGNYDKQTTFSKDGELE